MPEVWYGHEITNQINILDFVGNNEADILQYFGKIRNGKTYIATADIIELLNSGVVVYANWKVKWNGYDERDHLWPKLLGLLKLKKYFYKYPKENFHYLPLTSQEDWQKLYGNKNFTDIFGTLTSCAVFLDEGHLVFNSYEMTKLATEKLASILHTGHFDRGIRIISQRPTAIHVAMRANVNIFYECEKVLNLLGINIFRKTTYEEMTNTESVDI